MDLTEILQSIIYIVSAFSSTLSFISSYYYPSKVIQNSLVTCSKRRVYTFGQTTPSLLIISSSKSSNDSFPAKRITDNFLPDAVSDTHTSFCLIDSSCTSLSLSWLSHNSMLLMKVMLAGCCLLGLNLSKCQ